MQESSGILPYGIYLGRDEQRVDLPGFSPSLLRPLLCAEEHQPMVRAMLADRFKLAARFEQREAPIYELVVAKGGPNLVESSADEHSAITISMGRIEARHYSVDGLGFNLAGQLGRLVVNKTGLTSNYDFTLTWRPDQKEETAEPGPSIFTPLRSSLA